MLSIKVRGFIMIIKLIFALITAVFIQGCCYAALSSEQISSIEEKLFNQTFKSESIPQRLSRIENNAFGRTYNDSITNRMARIEKLKLHSQVPVSNNTQKPVVKYPRITKFEKELFNSAFENENIYNRLNRIEDRLFGNTYESLSLYDRVEQIANELDNKTTMPEVTGVTAMNNAAVPLNKLSDIERKMLNRTFENDNLTTRVERLETQLFGAVQSGNIDDRISNLLCAANTLVIPGLDFMSQSFSMPFTQGGH